MGVISTIRQRTSVGSVTLSIIVAVYLLLLLNKTFWTKSALIMAGQPVAFAMFIVGITAAYIALLVILSAKYIIKPVLILFVWAAAAGAWFMDQFGVIINGDMIRNAVETNSAEAGHLLTSGFIIHLVLYAVIPTVLICFIRVQHHAFPKKVVRNLAIVVPALLVFVGTGLSHAGVYAFAKRQNADWLATMNPIFPIGSAIHFVKKATDETHIKVQPYGTDAKVADASAIGSGERKPRVTIIVVGETARASSFQLGGYERPTNPELSKRDIFYFRKATSCGTATAISVPCMFSGLGHDDYDHKRALSRQNLMDVLVHAGIRAEWWDNNTGDKGVADRIPYTELFKSKDERYCHDGECWDDILLDKFDEWLASVKQDSVLVLHQLGSHGPAYYARYPDAYRKFVPDCRSSEFSKCHRDEIINAYDNSIVYTDHILSTLIDRLAVKQDQVSPTMIYMSDHGESLGEKGLFLHGAPWIVAPEQQTHIPFVLWLGKDARANIAAECLDRTEQQPVSHDNLFHTVLGMMHVQTKVHDPALDLYSACELNKNARS